MNKPGFKVLLWLATIFTLPSAWAIQLDTSFGDSGYVQTNISTIDNSNQQTHSVLVQADGKIVIAGSDDNGNDTDFALIRYHANGSRDLTFGEDGQVSTDLGSHDQLYDLVQQADGKIVAVGYTFYSNNDIVLLRYNTDGSLDDTFGTAGQVTTDTGVYELAYSIISQADGMLVIGAVVDTYMALIRYSEDGVLDTSFGDQGFAILRDDLDTYDRAQARDVIQQADGKLLAVGRNYIVRFNANGTLDTSFDTDGSNTVPASFSQILSIAQHNDGGFLVTGASTGGDFAVARFLSNGALDTDFGTAGMVTSNVGGGGGAWSIIADNLDNKFLVTGRGLNGADEQIVLLKYLANGDPDTSFSGDGKVEADFGDYKDTGISVVQQDDDKYVLAAQADDSGYTTPTAIIPGDSDFVTLRYDTDGNLDTSFGANGSVRDWVGYGTKDISRVLLEQADGKLIAGGHAVFSSIQSDLNTPTSIALTRYNTDGSLDKGYAANGRAVRSIVSPYNSINDVITLADGKTLSLIGTRDESEQRGGAMMRLDANGDADPTFGIDGLITLDSAPYGGMELPDNKLLLFVKGKLQRFLPSGSLDVGFGLGGSVTPAVCSAEVSSCGRYAMVRQAAGEVVIVGGYGLARYNSEGDLDLSFGSAGQILFASPVAWAKIAEQSDGKLLVAYLPGDQQNTLTINRYSADGELDTSYGTEGTTTTYIEHFSGLNFHALAMQEDDKLIAFVRVGSGDFQILRYDIFGDLDSSFDNDGMFPLPFTISNEGSTFINYGDLSYKSGEFTVLVTNKNDFFMAKFIDFETPPVAGAVVAADVAQANIGETTYAFSIDYSDANGDLESSSIGNSDVSVCNGGSCAVVTGTTWNGDSSSGTATYTITPPGGSWDAADNGTFTIAILATEVSDSLSTYVAADASAGSFTVSVTDPTVPDAPIIVSGTPANKGALIAFMPPANDGGSSILDYRVFCNGGTEAVGATSPLLATGLINGAGYNCYVWARNIVGESAASAVAYVTPTDGGDVTIPPSGEGPGEVVTFTQTATPPGGGDPIPATLSVVATESSPPAPPAEADSLVAAIDISSTSSVVGYTLVVTFVIEPESINEFTGFWKYGKEASGDTPHWYDYGTLEANGDGTGYEISEDKKSLTVHLIDGLRGDDDLLANAVIVDPALPIVQVSPVIFKDSFD